MRVNRNKQSVLRLYLSEENTCNQVLTFSKQAIRGLQRQCRSFLLVCMMMILWSNRFSTTLSLDQSGHSCLSKKHSFASGLLRSSHDPIREQQQYSSWTPQGDRSERCPLWVENQGSLFSFNGLLTAQHTFRTLLSHKTVISNIIREQGKTRKRGESPQKQSAHQIQVIQVTDQGSNPWEERSLKVDILAKDW